MTLELYSYDISHGLPLALTYVAPEPRYAQAFRRNSRNLFCNAAQVVPPLTTTLYVISYKRMRVAGWNSPAAATGPCAGYHPPPCDTGDFSPLIPHGHCVALTGAAA